MRALSGRRIELWVEARDGRPAVNPVMRALLDDLRRRGASTEVRVPESEIIDVDELSRRPPQLVLLKTSAAVATSLAVAQEASGASRFLNGAAPSRRAQDKAATTARLAAAGLPVPWTLLAEAGARLAAPGGCGDAWVVKPVLGIHGRGVSNHARFPRDLPAPLEDGQSTFLPDDGVRLVQKSVGEGPDVKTYVAGDHCFVTAKDFTPTSYASDAVTRRQPTSEEIALVRCVGETLGLRFFGVDLRYENGQPTIIDANSFPGYRGFPEAVPVLRREIERALLESSWT